jgi:mannitol-specific phosphotransferase system IIBC component
MNFSKYSNTVWQGSSFGIENWVVVNLGILSAILFGYFFRDVIVTGESIISAILCLLLFLVCTFVVSAAVAKYLDKLEDEFADIAKRAAETLNAQNKALAKSDATLAHLRVSVAKCAQAAKVETEELPVMGKDYSELLEFAINRQGWNRLISRIINTIKGFQ